MYIEKPPKKHSSYLNKQRRNWSFWLSIASLLLLIAAFCTPFWLQSWPRVHTPFDRLGLWEFCLDGYIHPKDEMMVSYYGCWWIFAPYFYNILIFLLPPWFIAVQIMVTISLIVQLIATIIYAVYTCHLVRNVERRAQVVRVIFILHCISAIFMFIVSVLFGVRCTDYNWMPNPTLNWPSWSYGLAILSNIFTIMDLPLLWLVMREDRHKIRYAENDFPMTAAREPAGKGKPMLYDAPGAESPRVDTLI
jgi:hypothetical protein